MNNNINDIWQNAITIVEPPTTRTLLKQKCRLVFLENSQAIIEVTHPALMRLFLDKTPNVEAAFTEVRQEKTKVSFFNKKDMEKLVSEDSEVLIELDNLIDSFISTCSKQKLTVGQTLSHMDNILNRLTELEKLEGISDETRGKITNAYKKINEYRIGLILDEYNESNRKRREKLTGNPSVW